MGVISVVYSGSIVCAVAPVDKPDLKKLPRLDSNQDKQIQNLLCYHYPTGH